MMKTISTLMKVTLFMALLLSLSLFAAEGEKAEQVSPQGKITKVEGTLLTLELTGETSPEAGKKYELYKHFTKNIFGVKTTGWLLAAEVTVKKVQDKLVTLKRDKSKSDITVNKKKVELIKLGATVKLELMTIKKAD